LVFPHNGWVKVNGVWRDTKHASWSRERGWRARARVTHYEGVPTIGPLECPADVRCPHCGNKRRLATDVLDVVAEIDMIWQTTRRYIQEQCADDPAALALFPEERPALWEGKVLHV
jgi:hypothetical protein